MEGSRIGLRTRPAIVAREIARVATCERIGEGDGGTFWCTCALRAGEGGWRWRLQRCAGSARRCGLAAWDCVPGIASAIARALPL